MNKQDTIDAIIIMQGYVDGEEIELRIKRKTKWRDNEFPAWVWGEFDYRIKPKPREVYVVFNSDGFVHDCVFSKEKIVGKGMSPVKFREVLDD